MLKKLIWSGLIAYAMTVSSLAIADSDPSVHQIYEAADAGHLAEAQRMVDQVLRDHPKSGKAHYVAAELFARAGKLPRARDELDIAEKLEPGLPFAKAASVQALHTELSQSLASESRAMSPRPPLLGLAVLALVFVGVVACFMRRRPATAAIVEPTGSMPSAPASPYTGTPPVAPGVGSGIAGGLVSGLAVGAGVVAGEELAHRLLDGNRSEGEPAHAANEPVGESQNPDLGGKDFGVSDGNSWNDDSGTQGDDDDWS